MNKQEPNPVIRVRVPASTANLGPGFDTIGMAFQLYTTITMRLAETTQIRPLSTELGGLPTGKDNLLYRAAAALFCEAGLPEPEIYMEVESEIPLTRGLGSSAAALIGALTGANRLAGEPFTAEQLFSIASKWEGHPDNVGASLFGGVVVATMPETEERLAPIPHVRLSVPNGIKTLVVIPDYELPTEKARSALPEHYHRGDMIYNVGRSSLLVAAMAQGRLDLLSQAMRDRLHQPYRCPLVPGLSEMLQMATEHGALGAALSGAGPTMLFFYSDDQQKERLQSFIDQVMTRHAIGYKAMVLLPDEKGATIDVSKSSGA
ncbi:homoserine kinase [Brevibacillus humidisoli]|uniref:homoserine kinase n=1 Tax=Brevibacillus humidisoli TaxID=2895522 RepID=UPI001E3ED768|nr:homoserine kinase [Brevibacillus humidisoli]UFJ39037.1 homoserine kinase [Brevibacillus humidisoli]